MKQIQNTSARYKVITFLSGWTFFGTYCIGISIDRSIGEETRAKLLPLHLSIEIEWVLHIIVAIMDLSKRLMDKL